MISNRFILPIKIRKPGRISKTFGEGIGVNFQFGDELILVGCYCGKHGFGEDERSILFLFEVSNGP